MLLVGLPMTMFFSIGKILNKRQPTLSNISGYKIDGVENGIKNFF